MGSKSNDHLWLELLSKSLEDLGSVRLVRDDSSIAELKQSIRHQVAELENRETPVTPGRPKSLKRESPEWARWLKIFQFTNCIIPAKALVRRSRQSIDESHQRLNRSRMLTGTRQTSCV